MSGIIFSRGLFLLFLVIGCINTFDCTLFAKVLIYFGLAANLAFNVGYLLSNIIAYWLNSVFVFTASSAFRAT